MRNNDVEEEGLRICLKALTTFLILLLTLSMIQTVSGYSGRVTNPNDGIEKYRKGDVVLRALDGEGRPVTGASVSYLQVTRDFLFGMPPQAPDESTWFLLKEAGVNYVQLFMSWNLTDGSGFKGWVDSNYNPPLLQRRGIVLLSGHCLVWMVGSYPEIPGADPWNLPTRVNTLKYDELRKELYDHVYVTVSTYKSLIRYWGINEPFWPYADPFHLNTQQWLEIVSLSVQAIRRADPAAKIYMNNLLGDVPSSSYYPLKDMRLLVEKGIEFDMIGLEVYGKHRTPGVPSDSNGNPVVQPVSKRLDKWAELGKPIILTEVDVTSEPNEKTQAQWLRDFYTMAFAKRYVKGVVWSFMFDNPWLPKAGIFDCQKSDQYGGCLSGQKPRQAYYALKNLTSSWLTEGKGTTDTEGQLRFRGFAGNYSITITAEGFEPLDSAIHVQEQVENPFEIHMHTKTVSATTTTTERRSIALTSTLAPSTVTPSYAFTLSQQEIFVAVVGVLVLCLVVEIAVTRKRRKRQ